MKYRIAVVLTVPDYLVLGNKAKEDPRVFVPKMLKKALTPRLYPYEPKFIYINTVEK